MQRICLSKMLQYFHAALTILLQLIKGSGMQTAAAGGHESPITNHQSLLS